MPNIHDILFEKGPHVHSVGPEATVLDATRRMNEHKIGALVVLDGGRVVGMFTERDVLQRVVAEACFPAEVRIRDVMSTEIVCCNKQTSIDDARSIMKTRRIRHLPVVDEDGSLQGLISIGDLNAFALNGHEVTIHMMHEYIQGGVR